MEIKGLRPIMGITCLQHVMGIIRRCSIMAD